MKDVGVTNDVARPRRPNEDERNILDDHRFQEGLPGRTRGCRIFVRKVDQLDALFPMQARQLSGELHRIAMPPGAPKLVLAAIMTTMRTAPRELHYHRAAFPVISVTAVINEFPADAT